MKQLIIIIVIAVLLFAGRLLIEFWRAKKNDRKSDDSE